MSVERDLKILHEKGERITPIREAILEILGKSQRPRTPAEILEKIKKHNSKTNKTTIYRQLESLKKLKIIQEVQFADRAKRYELVESGSHHHHLICQSCGKIKDAELPSDLKNEEMTIWKKDHFKVLRHSLEFFGTCATCIKN